MKKMFPSNKKIFLIFCLALNTAFLFSGSPGLIWHQAYGELNLDQRLLVMAADNYDNTFAAGYVNFGNYGNIIINRYDGVGNLKWNRIYDNFPVSNAIDKPVALFPDNQAGITLVGFVNSRATQTHILKYGPSGILVSDVTVGDSASGKYTAPFEVIYDGASDYYMLGALNSVPKVFKCDNNGNILWSSALHNNHNPNVGSIKFDNYGSLVVGVFDSASAQVIIHRYDMASGNELSGFNTHVTSLPVNDNFIKILVDPASNIYLAATGADSAGKSQLVVDKFDTSGALLATTMCNASKGHSNMVNGFLLTNTGDIVISGPYADDTDAWQYGALYKVASTGGVVWSAIDSQFLVNNASAVVDLYGNIYLGTTKTSSSISPYYSDFSFTKFSPDSGVVQWNRNFDNTANNTGLLMQANNFGDLFLATNTTTDTGSTWFLARIGNTAGDSLGTGVTDISVPVNDLVIYPNPFSSITNIGFTAKQEGEGTLRIYDIMGQVLQQQPVQYFPGYNQISVNTNIAAGAYLFKLEQGKDSRTRRVIVY